MQEVSGAYLTGLNGVAQLSSIDMAMHQGLHPFLRKSFAPQIQATTRRVERRTGIRPPVARVGRWPTVSGLAQSSARRVPRSIAVFGNMMIDCSCVCHLRFQNEVIGG